MTPEVTTQEAGGKLPKFIPKDEYTYTLRVLKNLPQRRDQVMYGWKKTEGYYGDHRDGEARTRLVILEVNGIESIWFASSNNPLLARLETGKMYTAIRHFIESKKIHEWNVQEVDIE